MPAFRIHLLSGNVVTVPTGQFPSVEVLHGQLSTMDPWSPVHVQGVISAGLADALKVTLATKTATNEICIARDAVMAVERI